MLFRAVVNSSAVEGAVVKDSDPEPIDTSSDLNWFQSREILDSGTLRVIFDKLFYFLCNSKKKCYRNCVLDKSAKLGSS